MTQISQHPFKTPVYSSPSINARRARLLKETRRMIGEKGLQGFSIRELCQRSDVSPRTLYNNFHDKHRLIGIAIKESYDQISDSLHFHTELDSVAGLLMRAIAVCQRNLSARNYASAVASIYFSPETPEDLWKVLQGMAVRGIEEYLLKQEAKGDLHDWIIIDHLAADMANVEYGLINDWCAGRLTDELYPLRLVESVLLSIAGATKGDQSSEAIEYLKGIRNTGKLPKLPRPVSRTSRPGKQAVKL